MAKIYISVLPNEDFLREKSDYAIQKAGYCLGYSGGVEDASDRTEEIINNNWWNAYYLNFYNPQDVKYHTSISSNFIGYGQTNCGGFGNIDPHDCIAPSQMENTLQLNELAVFCNIPTGSQLIVFEVFWDPYFGSGNVVHNVQNWHGIPHIQ